MFKLLYDPPCKCQLQWSRIDNRSHRSSTSLPPYSWESDHTRQGIWRTKPMKTLQQTEGKLFTLWTCSDGAGLVLPRMDSWDWMWLETPKESLEWDQAHGQTVWTSLVWRLCGQHGWIPSCRVSVARCRRRRGTAPLNDQFLNEEVFAPSDPLLISAWRDKASALNVIWHC